MTIEDIKQGDKIYYIDNYEVKYYTYLCVHPMGQSKYGNYHILIDVNENPIRLYQTRLQDILNKNLTSYPQATLALAEKLEAYEKRLREEYPSL